MSSCKELKAIAPSEKEYREVPKNMQPILKYIFSEECLTSENVSVNRQFSMYSFRCFYIKE